jgi:hypothetical protein
MEKNMLTPLFEPSGTDAIRGDVGLHGLRYFLFHSHGD